MMIIQSIRNIIETMRLRLLSLKQKPIRKNWADEDITIGGAPGEPTEYFCTKCLQLRLSMTKNKHHCGYCKSTKIINGRIGSLDKQALLKQHTPKREKRRLF